VHPLLAGARLRRQFQVWTSVLAGPIERVGQSTTPAPIETSAEQLVVSDRGPHPHSPPSQRPDRERSARRRPTSRALRVASRWPTAILDPGDRRASDSRVGGHSGQAHPRTPCALRRPDERGIWRTGCRARARLPRGPA